MALATLGRVKGDTARPEYLHSVEVVELIGDGEGKDGEICERPPRFQAGRCRILSLFPEKPLADNIAVII